MMSFAQRASELCRQYTAAQIHRRLKTASQARRLKIVLNGNLKEVGEDIAVEELIETLELSPGQVAVEVNGGLIVRAERAACQLKESDVVELVTLVGGG